MVSHDSYPGLSELPAESKEVDTLSSTIIERHPDWPELSVLFYLGPHGNRYDSEYIKEMLLPAADVLLLENSTPELTGALQSLSGNVSRPLDDILDNNSINGRPARTTFLGPIIEGLYRSGKIVGDIDMREQPDVEMKTALTQSATLVVADKYCRTADD